MPVVRPEDGAQDAVRHIGPHVQQPCRIVRDRLVVGGVNGHRRKALHPRPVVGLDGRQQVVDVLVLEAADVVAVVEIPERGKRRGVSTNPKTLEVIGARKEKRRGRGWDSSWRERRRIEAEQEVNEGGGGGHKPLQNVRRLAMQQEMKTGIRTGNSLTRLCSLHDRRINEHAKVAHLLQKSWTSKVAKLRRLERRIWSC